MCIRLKLSYTIHQRIAIENKIGDKTFSQKYGKTSCHRDPLIQ